jgi:chromate transporter
MQPRPVPLRRFLLYFLKLGTLGFGGPIALAGYMQRDLVEREKWITPDDYKQGLALAQLAPGPLAAQLAIYLGWVRARVWGATAVSFAFILPSFVIVLVLSALYLRLGGLAWMQGAFYGIGAAVIAIIARSCYKLVRSTLASDRLLWVICAVSALVTAATESEIAWIFIAGGVLALFIRRATRAGRASTVLLAALPPWLLTGLSGPAPESVLLKIAAFFSEAGAFVFGSGLAIVPFLYGGVVEQYHWLTERQFLDAVAIAMITPGPVVITVAFIGYLVAGPLGASIAAFAVFLPCYLFVILPAPYFRKFANNPDVHAFVDGVTAAAAGAIAGAAIVLGKRAIVDVATIMIFVAVLVLLIRARRIPEPAIILAAGVVGILLKSTIR